MLKEFERFAACVNAKKDAISSSCRGVVVACSGGPDSTALFHLIWRLSQAENNFSVALAHVAYGLRGDESENDFAFVQNLAASHGVPFFSHRINEIAPTVGIQAWARGIRRQFFSELAAEGWVIALAHHLDDVAETALFRLARGTSPENAAGMRVWDPPYWRPLLEERKATLTAFLARENLPFRTDSSNARDDYARNVIRHRVLPELEALFPGAAERIALTALQAQSPLPEAAVAQQSLKEQLPRGTQLSRRLLQSLPGGHVLVAPPPIVTKARRESQHRLSLKAFEASVLLEPGSNVTLSRGKRRWRFLAPSISQPCTLRASGIGLKSLLRFSCTDGGAPHRVSRSWTLKELSRRWEVPQDAREEYLAIEYNQELIGLFDGQAVVKPSDTDGAKQLLDQLIFERS